MTGSQKRKLKTIVSGFYDGPHATPKESDSGAIFLGIKNVTEDGHLDLSEIRFIADEDMPKWTKRVTPQEGDIVFSYEATLHRYAMIPKGFNGCLGRRMALIRINEDEADRRFILHYFLSPLWRREVEKNILNGATVDRIPLTNVPDFSLNLPPLPLQIKIASILSAYDDLIENNIKRIKLLEEIAHRTYEEWFVKFRINGEQLPIDEETGLPVGWEKKFFPDLVDFKEGPGLRNNQYRSEGIPFLNIRVIKDDDVDFSKIQYLEKDEVKNKYPHFLLKENDHVISTSGTLGRVVTIRKRHLPLCLNTSLIRMRPKNKNFGKWLIKHTISNPKFKETMLSYANGSAQINFGPIHLKQIKLIAPTDEVAIKYEDFANPIELKIQTLKDQNLLLKESRDLLLPRLMNGTIKVSES
jgi:type I restriction enzyme, S subunit